MGQSWRELPCSGDYLSTVFCCCCVCPLGGGLVAVRGGVVPAEGASESRLTQDACRQDVVFSNSTESKYC